MPASHGGNIAMHRLTALSHGGKTAMHRLTELSHSGKTERQDRSPAFLFGDVDACLCMRLCCSEFIGCHRIGFHFARHEVDTNLLCLVPLEVGIVAKELCVMCRFVVISIGGSIRTDVEANGNG